jgi:alkyl sulfatase BDS1-like metallo-beta-lactamase superfamily hydrolase
MGRVADLAERLWTGEESTERLQPVTTLLGLEAFAPGLAFVASFANVTVVETAEGLVLIDTGSFFLAANNHAQIREWTAKPVHSAIYTHGHVDHAFGLEPFEKEQAERGGPPIAVIAHEAVPARFERYQLTAGYNEVINRRQFGAATWPTRYRFPDRTYRSELMLEVGGERFELEHARGETDDHTWLFVPGKKLLCPGDLFIWASPNCGNPQKVQRYPREWARALRKMATRDAEQLFPGHGPPIFGAARVRQALEETAELLELLHDQTLALMNQGARLNDILHEIKAPERLLARPYLRPVYDEPEFIVRNIWRLYGGWYDGNPAALKPARDAEVAAELAALSGGAARLAARAETLSANGEHRLACHLIELARQAAPEDAEIAALRSRIYLSRASAETSLMAKGVFTAAARER